MRRSGRLPEFVHVLNPCRIFNQQLKFPLAPSITCAWGVIELERKWRSAQLPEFALCLW
jgi:hypothetical protein